MPIYEYECESCKARFNALVRSFSTPDEEVKCPHCEQNAVHRLLSMNAAVATSGSGGGCSAPAGSAFG